MIGGGSTPTEKPYFAFDIGYRTGPIIRVRNGKANVLGDTTAQLCHTWNLSNGNMITGPKPTISDVKNSYFNKFPLNPLNIIEWGIVEETETTFDLSLVEIIS